MKILIIGSGGREHALAWRLAQSPKSTRSIAAPGNPGIAQVATCLPVADSSPALTWPRPKSVDADLTVVGPEAPLVAGVVDRFRAARPPDRRSRRRQPRSSKAARSSPRTSCSTAASPPRASSAVDAAEARAALDRFGFPVVIKADGLARAKASSSRKTAPKPKPPYRSLGPPLVIEEF